MNRRSFLAWFPAGYVAAIATMSTRTAELMGQVAAARMSSPNVGVDLASGSMTTVINIQGEGFSRKQIRELIEQINQELAAPARVTFTPTPRVTFTPTPTPPPPA